MPNESKTPAAERAPLPHFATRLLIWHQAHGRHDLPWQRPRTPYRVWLSEIMLQQTQVATVVPYFEHFVNVLPDLPALAHAPMDEVMRLWSGLGYYSRARNLHAAARLCLEHHRGELPADLDMLMSLPGIGRSTAGAILAQAFGRRAAILDGNVKRVLSRSHGVDGFPGIPAIERQLWQLSENLLPERNLADYTQAIMDLGATVCTRSKPACPLCPVRDDCIALSSGRVAELPAPRPARTLPQRTCHWLLLLDADDHVLLERRPPHGIWGGLWSLPEFADADSLGAALALRWNCGFRELETLAPVRHVFSHYALTAQPLRCRIDRPAFAIADDGKERWFAPHERLSVGLPQPVKRLLARQ